MSDIARDAAIGHDSDPDKKSAMVFPDVARLQLDELLGELTGRAQDVLAVQGRLRGLLRANAAVGAELSVRVVLRRIVEAARELVGARYAALGVIGRAGELEAFVHVGMDEELVARIGQLPRGGGILGLLINEPAPIRGPIHRRWVSRRTIHRCGGFSVSRSGFVIRCSATST